MTVSRQLRLSDRSEIRRRASEFLGKKINIVLADSRVLFGDVVAAGERGITVKNLRGKRVEYPYSDIDELYYDTVTHA